MERKLGYNVTVDIKSIAVLLATQAMINMGEIQDPITTERKNDMEGALVFIQLLDVLETKTKGNLTPEETSFLSNIKENLDKVYNKKYFSGNQHEE
jgi:hypothetical protein